MINWNKSLPLIKWMSQEYLDVNAYTEAGAAMKELYARQGKAFLRRLATDCGMLPGSFDIRFNPGGVAISGDLSLHHDNVYINFNAGVCRDLGIMYRTCNGRKNYQGHGVNQWQRWPELLNEGRYNAFCDRIHTIADPAWTPEVSYQHTVYGGW